MKKKTHKMFHLEKLRWFQSKMLIRNIQNTYHDTEIAGLRVATIEASKLAKLKCLAKRWAVVNRCAMSIKANFASITKRVPPPIHGKLEDVNL